MRKAGLPECQNRSSIRPLAPSLSDMSVRGEWHKAGQDLALGIGHSCCCFPLPLLLATVSLFAFGLGHRTRALVTPPVCQLWAQPPFYEGALTHRQRGGVERSGDPAGSR